jgi:chromosome partitioning protein
MNATTPPTIITFASSKGGAGKSTCSAAIAGALAARGSAVTLIDLDVNGTLTRWYKHHADRLPSITVVQATPSTLTQLLAKAASNSSDHIIIDVAGAYEAAMVKAIAASSLVITPAKLSEPDLREAAKVLAEVDAFNRSFNANIPHRLLVNEAETLNPMYQRHALAEIDASALTRFKHLMNRRAAYREIFLTGLPPHYAEKGRGPIDKAVAELDDIIAEIDATLIQTTKAKAA